MSHFHRRARVRNLGIEGDDALEMAEQAESRPGRSQLAPTPAGARRSREATEVSRTEVRSRMGDRHSRHVQELRILASEFPNAAWGRVSQILRCRGGEL